MSRIVGVHGIAQEVKGPNVLESEWAPAMQDGVRFAGGALQPGDLRCASYGELFRPAGDLRAIGENVRPSDLTDDEVELLQLWWAESAKIEPDRVFAPGAATRGPIPGGVQAALRALTGSRFFANLVERAVLGALKQVRRYLREPEIRTAARKAVDDMVTADTCVLVGHSLGSVVAYEALHAYAGSERWANVRTFVTLGSPLGIPNLIFDALDPEPTSEGVGRWPPRVIRWTNVSDDGDVVALIKKLSPLFSADGELVDIRISNGATVHGISPYLTARETGRAIMDGLA